MTVVAVRKNKSTIEISCDEQISRGRHKYKMSDNKKSDEGDAGKIYKVNGMLIGGAGYLSELNLFKLFCKNHKPIAASEDAIMEFMLEFRQWISKKTGDDDYELYNVYLMVIDNRIFEIDYGFHISEKGEFAAIGSGTFLALAALHFGKTTKEAVEVAKIYDLYCGGETQTIKINIK